MSLTDNSEKDDLLLLRARYVELLRALRRTAEHNLETLEALERILPESMLETPDQKRHLPAVPPADPTATPKHHAA